MWIRAKSGIISALASILVFALTATLVVPALSPVFGQARRTPPRPLMPLIPALPVEAVADFDGDMLPDRAELISNGFDKDIRLEFGSPWVTSLHFSSDVQQTGSLHAKDIDQDSDEDLIWISARHSAGAALWLNNGLGEFTRLSEPTAAFVAEIENLSPDESRTGSLASGVGASQKALGAGRYAPPARAADHLFESPHAPPPPAFIDGVIEQPPCISRYPKRGPPAFSAFA